MAYRPHVHSNTRGNAMLRCGSHGSKPWRGDVMCADCGRIYLRDVAAGIFPDAPEDGRCRCGVRLFPVRTGDNLERIDRSKYFSARAVCAFCADAKAGAKGVN